MENLDIKMCNDLGTSEMHKSAIIYRDDSARFIYVCFHCGRMFVEINETLRHIESHFELANVMVDQFTSDNKEENSVDTFAMIPAPETVNVKVEMLDEEETDNISVPMDVDDIREFRCKFCNTIHQSRFLIRTHVLKAHIQEPMKCRHCTSSFINSVDFEQHIKTHIARHEVNWKSVTDGIQTIDEIDWSIYETTDLELLGNKVVKGKTKRIPPAKLTTVNKNRNKLAMKTSPNTATSAPTAVRPYQCHKCAINCRNMTILRSHMKIHTDDELLHVFKCKECDCYYKNAFALRTHVLQVHLMIKRFSCNACGDQFTVSQSKQFEEHLQQHNGSDNKLWADIKDGIYNQTGDLSQYEETDSFTEQKYSCEFCTQKFYIKCNLDVHIKSIHSSQRRLQCSQCYSIFTTPKYYYAHQLGHQRCGTNITECDENELLASLDALIDERIIYHGDEFNKQPYRCLICNATFDVHYDIRSHIMRLHVYKMFPSPLELKKEFICDMCGKLLKSRAAMEKHLLIHTNTKTHACKFCGKTFRICSTKKIHERQHTGEKPYQCDECGKAFISKGLLTAHKKCHEDTTYSCQICGKTFNLPSGYRNHVKTHRQDRPFKCTVCEKTFNTKIYLMRHMVIHSDKKYKCRYCESEFNTGAGRRQHHRHKHKDEVSTLMM